MKKNLLFITMLLTTIGIAAQGLSTPTNFQDSVQALVSLGQSKPSDADLNRRIKLLQKKTAAYTKQANMPSAINERHRQELLQLYEQIVQSYQNTYGEIKLSDAGQQKSNVSPIQQNFSSDTQGENLPVSLVGRAYSGVVLTSNAEHDKNFNCTYTIIFCSKEKCMVMWDYTLKEQKTPDNYELAVAAEQLSGMRDFRYIYHNEYGNLRIIDDSGSMVLQDNGKKIKMIDDKALHGDIYLLDDEKCKCLLEQLGYGTDLANFIERNKIPHRDYNGNIIYSSLSEIEKLLNGDVAGYYKIPGISTEVQKKVYSQSDDYKNIYLPRLRKEKEYLLEDEYEQLFKINAGNVYSDVWGLTYDLKSRRFLFELRFNETERYQLSNEKGFFHVLVNTDNCDYGFCLTYPKSLVAVYNRMSSIDGKMGQEQILYTGVIPEIEAAKFYPERKNSLLWRFKIEKVKNGRLYGKSTKLCVVEGEAHDNKYDGRKYLYIEQKDQPRKIVVDLTNTLSEAGNTYKSVKTK